MDCLMMLPPLFAGHQTLMAILATVGFRDSPSRCSPRSKIGRFRSVDERRKRLPEPLCRDTFIRLIRATTSDYNT